MQKPWRAVIERAKVRTLRLHDVRHSFASAAVAKGVSLYVVGKLLGHRQGPLRNDTRHIEEGSAREALNHIAGAIGGAK